ncbi:carbohydrate kinase family protein [Candidatus Sumerlaeota bacterium]|nr:carbohydrate kinase family protein [Candidatus Sumerlaeota bacterium]
MPQAVVIGNLCLDDLVHPGGQVIERQLGGSALFGVLGLRLWAESPGVMGRMGQGYPPSARERLRAAGIDTEGMVSVDSPAVHNRIDYSCPGGRRLLRLAGSPEANSPRPTDWPPQWHDTASVHLASMPVEIQIEWLGFLQRLGVAVSLDPHLRSCSEERESLRRAMSLCDLFLPSDLELGMLFPDLPLAAAAREVAGWTRHGAIITCGARGVYVPRDDVWLPPCPVAEVVDQTGAGDAYASVFIWHWSHHRDIRAAHRHAAVAAALMIEGAGGLHTLDIPCDAAGQRLDQWRREER